MGKRKKRRAASGKHRNTLAKIFSIGGTVLLILVIVLCIPITVPRLFGYDIYTVISGSMEPAIPTGSLIYTKEIPPKEVKKEDVIAFYRVTDSGAIVTHRVVKNQTVSGKFITKGDANEKKDPMPVDYDELLGKVALSVPFLGRILATVATTSGKAAAACLIGVVVIFHIIAGRLRVDDEY